MPVFCDMPIFRTGEFKAIPNRRILIPQMESGIRFCE